MKFEEVDAQGGIVVLDDVIEVLLFSVSVQLAILLTQVGELSLAKILLPVTLDFGLAIALGLGVFLLLFVVVERRWLKPKRNSQAGPVLGPEFLSRLISEMPGPSIETFILIGGCVALGVGFALHWHAPFLITAITAGILISNFYSQQSLLLDPVQIRKPFVVSVN